MVLEFFNPFIVYLCLLDKQVEILSWVSEQRKQMVFTRLNMLEVSHISILTTFRSRHTHSSALDKIDKIFFIFSLSLNFSALGHLKCCTFHLNPVTSTVHNISEEKPYSINADKNQKLIPVADAAALTLFFKAIFDGSLTVTGKSSTLDNTSAFGTT